MGKEKAGDAGGSGGPVFRRLFCLLLTAAVCGCAAAAPGNPSFSHRDSYHGSKADRYVLRRPMTRPPSGGPIAISAQSPVFGGSQADSPPYSSAYKTPAEAGYARKCSLGHRFDRSEELAYNFRDGQSRLALDLSIDGFSWGDLGDFEFKEVMVRYRYRFQQGKKGRERCLYDSPLQGLVGSVYNEMFVREDETVWEELDDRGVYFWRD